MVCKNGNTLYSTQLAGGSIILAFEEDYKERNEPCNAQGSRLSSCYTIKVGQQYSAPHIACTIIIGLLRTRISGIWLTVIA